jgi:hypothetical protein
MEWDSTIEEAELIEIIQAKAKNRVISVTEYQPKPKYLTLYLGVIFNGGKYENALILTLSETSSEKFGNALAMIKCFGKFVENELVYDSIRCTLHGEIVKEVGENTLYFQEFFTNCKGRYNSILEILGGIFKCFSYHVEDKTHIKAMCQRLTEVCEN